jgi:hypothetical protein
MRAVGGSELAHRHLGMLVDSPLGDVEDLADLPGGFAL